MIYDLWFLNICCLCCLNSSFWSFLGFTLTCRAHHFQRLVLCSPSGFRPSTQTTLHPALSLLVATSLQQLCTELSWTRYFWGFHQFGCCIAILKSCPPKKTQLHVSSAIFLAQALEQFLRTFFWPCDSAGWKRYGNGAPPPGSRGPHGLGPRVPWSKVQVWRWCRAEPLAGGTTEQDEDVCHAGQPGWEVEYGLPRCNGNRVCTFYISLYLYVYIIIYICTYVYVNI